MTVIFALGIDVKNSLKSTAAAAASGALDQSGDVQAAGLVGFYNTLDFLAGVLAVLAGPVERPRVWVNRGGFHGAFYIGLVYCWHLNVKNIYATIGPHSAGHLWNPGRASVAYGGIAGSLSHLESGQMIRDISLNLFRDVVGIGLLITYK